jgi:hypothetical protein
MPEGCPSECRHARPLFGGSLCPGCEDYLKRVRAIYGPNYKRIEDYP